MSQTTSTGSSRGNPFDDALAGVFDAREDDWRNGAVVYQILVDRFAPPADLAAKAHLYPAPKVLRRWDELPQRGQYLPEAMMWSHEIEFWGGDLASARTKLDHVIGLGADVVYLNPIHLAYTNHAYDALDYAEVAPHFGSRADVVKLAADLHDKGLRLVLDGVFNHMGRNSKYFQAAEADETSPYRSWFDFGAQYPSGVRCWWLAENLPELVLENPAVREYVYAGHDSIVRGYLRDGVDGWRLDVAVDIGMEFLAELTAAAHEEKPGSLVVGEVACYPKEWFPALDAVMGFALREVILTLAAHEISPTLGWRMISRLVTEADYEHVLKSWIFLENHDTARLATRIPDPGARRLAQVLQFTLPGAPNIYYGSELGMTGDEDPQMRAPMRWDLVTPDNPELSWYRKLIELHQTHRALRVGNIREVTCEKLLGFERYTDHVADTVVVLVNPSDSQVTEFVQLGNSKLMNPFRMLDLLGDPPVEVLITNATLTVTLPPNGVLVLAPEIHPEGGYTSYKRVQ